MRSASSWLLTSTWDAAPRLRALVDAAHTVAEEEQDDGFDSTVLMGSIEYAEGIYLDLIGQRLDCFPRPVIQGTGLSDAEYQKVLRALGRARRSNGSLAAVEEALSLAIRPGLSLTDNQNMTVTLLVSPSERREALIALHCGALGIPAGVQLIITDTAAQITGLTATAGDERAVLSWTAPEEPEA